MRLRCLPDCLADVAHSEVEMASLLRGRVMIPVPELLAEGPLGRVVVTERPPRDAEALA